MRTILISLSLALALLCAATILGQGRRGDTSAGTRHIVFGDVKIAQGPSDKPIMLDIILFDEYGSQRGEQRFRVREVSLHRYSDGRYYIVIQHEGAEPIAHR